MTLNRLPASSSRYVTPPRYRTLGLTVFMHVLLLWVMWLAWPTPFGQRGLRYTHAPQRIDVSLATVDQLPLNSATNSAIDSAINSATQTRELAQPTLPQRKVRQGHLPLDKPSAIKSTELRLDAPATDVSENANPTVNNIPSNNIAEEPPATANAPIVGNHAQREAIRQAIKQPGVAQQMNQQLGGLGVGKPSQAQAFSNEVKKAELEECLASNENGGLLNILFIAVKKSKGKCK